jgi:hypothetical protein
MPDSVYGPWEQEEGSDYDEPGSGGDSHEDEFDEEYGEQRPHGDPDRPDNALEDAYQADIEYWEAIARLNAIARPFDPDGPFASDAAALNPHAHPFDPDETIASDAAAVSPFGDKLEDSSDVALSSQLTSLDPDDFDYAESIEDVGPPAPEGAAVRQTFDPAIEFTDTLVETNRTESLDSPIIDSAASEPETISSQSFDPAVQFSDALGDTSLSLSSPASSPDSFEPDDTYQPESFDPAVQFQPDIGERTDPTDFLG